MRRRKNLKFPESLNCNRQKLKPVVGGYVMLPICFEWIWDMVHVVFHGALWYALTIIGLGMTYCIAKAAIDTLKGGDANHH